MVHGGWGPAVAEPKREIQPKSRPCVFCKGSGRCTRCEGEGERRIHRRWPRRDEAFECPACEGSGECGLCHGSGRADA